MNRPTREEIEDIRANDCGHPECGECGARMKLLAEIDALRKQYGSFAWQSICAERDGLAARVRELEAVLRDIGEAATLCPTGEMLAQMIRRILAEAPTQRDP